MEPLHPADMYETKFSLAVIVVLYVWAVGMLLSGDWDKFFVHVEWVLHGFEGMWGG